MTRSQSYPELATPESIDMLRHIRRVVARSGVYVDLDDRATQVNQVELRFLDDLILKLEAQLKARAKEHAPGGQRPSVIQLKKMLSNAEKRF